MSVADLRSIIEILLLSFEVGILAALVGIIYSDMRKDKEKEQKDK